MRAVVQLDSGSIKREPLVRDSDVRLTASDTYSEIWSFHFAFVHIANISLHPGRDNSIPYVVSMFRLQKLDFGCCQWNFYSSCRFVFQVLNVKKFHSSKVIDANIFEDLSCNNAKGFIKKQLPPNACRTKFGLFYFYSVVFSHELLN